MPTESPRNTAGELQAHTVNMIDINQIKKEVDEYKRFAFKDDLLKLAIAFIIGGALTKAVSAISECLIMPAVNYLVKFTGTNWRQLSWSPLINLTFEIGKFSAAMVDFFLTTIVLFILWKVAVHFQITAPLPPTTTPMPTPAPAPPPPAKKKRRRRKKRRPTVDL